MRHTIDRPVQRRLLHGAFSGTLMLSTLLGLSTGYPANAATPAHAFYVKPLTAQLTTHPAAPQAELQSLAKVNYGKLPTAFIANAGQLDSAVHYAVSSSAGSLFFTPDGVTLSIPLISNSPLIDTPTTANNLTNPLAALPRPTAPRSAVAIKLNFAGANENAVIEGTDPLPGVVNYLIGNDPAKWHTDVRTYAGVAYRHVYPGIDLSYTGHVDTLKGTYTVAPGADPNQIRWQYAGADSTAIDAQSGDLHIQASSAALTEQVPEVWQVRTDGSHRSITARYQIDPHGMVQFALGDYDHTQALIIDPGLVYSTYLGGSGDDSAAGIVLDSTGAAYITGSTSSTNFPISTGAYQIGSAGGTDAFVTKLNVAGNAIWYETYLGGSGSDVGNGIAVDGLGYSYITGSTSSNDFPTTVGAYQTSRAGLDDAFVTELRPDGKSLYYSTYLGGSTTDIGYQITVDSTYHAYVTGFTESSNFPTTLGAYQTTLGGNTDAFVVKVAADGSGLDYSTYIGKSQANVSRGIALDSSNDAYITGYTNGNNFPTTINAYQTTFGGNADAFMTEVSPDGSMLLYSTLLGGSGDDYGYGIALDRGGYVYVAGTTSGGGFPTTANAFQRSENVNSRAHSFVTEFDPPGLDSAVYYSTYLGGTGGPDHISAIAVDSHDQAHVTGYTQSTDFPTTSGAFQTVLKGTALVGNQNSFVTVLTVDGSKLVHSTYLGGTDVDAARGIAVDYAGDSYVVGSTKSSNFPVLNAFQATAQGLSDAFVTKLQTLPLHLDTIGIYRAGTFYLRWTNTQGYSNLSIAFNPPGNNFPVVGDWVGYQFDTVGVYNQTSGVFTWCTAVALSDCANSSNQARFTFGNPNDTPLSGRWWISATHDGTGVYRSSNGILYLKNQLSTGFADYAMVMGNPGDRGVAGDWTGKSFDSPGIYRPGNIAFYVSNQVTNGPVYADLIATYGSGTDLPITGDWVAQSHDGIGMFRPANGFVYLRNTVTSGFSDNAFFYGNAGDIPIAGHWSGNTPAPSKFKPPMLIAPSILLPKTLTPAPTRLPNNGSAPGNNQIGG